MHLIGSIDWSFLEGILGERGKILAAIVAVVVGIISLAIAIYKHKHAQTLERILSHGAANIQKKDAVLQRAADRLKEQRTQLELQKAELELREKRLSDVRAGFIGKEHDLWCMHAPRPPQDYDELMKQQRKKPIIMVANLKGGVGKTTLTANLAACFSAAGKRVLLVDVDYQGSLSNMLLSADGVEDVPLGITELLAGNPDIEVVPVV
jgi:Mrp family chromosome partitioning ATPase